MDPRFCYVCDLKIGNVVATLSGARRSALELVDAGQVWAV